MKQLPIYATLKNSPQIVDLLGDKIYEDIAPENTKPPYLVWGEISGLPNNSIDNITNEDHVSFQIVVYSPNQSVALDIRSLVSEALHEYSFIDERFGSYEKDTRLFARGFSANWWLNR